MVAELKADNIKPSESCSLAKISMVAEHSITYTLETCSCSLAKISMVAEREERIKNL